MNLDEDIAYWTKCMEEHPSKEASLMAFCVATGLKIAKADYLSPRMLKTDNDHAVCVGGRWDGWLMWKHPDGQWVSVRKLEQERPHS